MLRTARVWNSCLNTLNTYFKESKKLNIEENYYQKYVAAPIFRTQTKRFPRLKFWRRKSRKKSNGITEFGT